jgi:methyl-accepting chemotaxis protein
MNLLSHLKLRTKLVLLVGLSALALVISIGMAASLMHQRMIDDRIDKLRAVVQSTIGIAQVLETQITAHQITREQAFEHLRTDIHGMRFDAGAGYIIMRRDATILLHGADPSLEGKPSATKDANGRMLSDLIQDALRGSDNGVVSYLFPKPGATEPLLKLSYVATYTPWQVVFFAGAYVDDLESVFRATLLHLSVIGGIILSVTLIAAWLVNRDISLSLGNLKTAMERLATGDLATSIPGTDRRDEVGGMAKSVLVFKHHMEREDELASTQAAEREHAAAEKRTALTSMADKIESETGTYLEKIHRRTASMTMTADAMSASASRTGAAAATAASAAGQAMTNAQSVAGAAEQLSASIREISSQMSQSAAVVARAVTAGSETRTTIEALNIQVERIGAVADMIGEIAAKTNLLALNATIEAARAGDAGKGFAVVASEVKALATQTARSTQEITQHINEVRAATGASVAAVGRIEATITEVSAIAGSIAAAVEQQGAATAEIARNVTETASAADEVTTRTAEVSAEAGDTGRHATEVRENIVCLNAAMEELRHSVIRAVRTSTEEADRRREYRYQADRACRVSIAGQSFTARVTDLSEHGAFICNAPSAQIGTRGTLTLDGIALSLPFRICAVGDGGLHLEFELDEATAIKFRPVPEQVGMRRAA